MPSFEITPTGGTTAEQRSLTEGAQEQQLEGFESNPIVDKPGWWEALIEERISGRLEGGVIQRVDMARRAWRAGISDEKDHNFNPYDIMEEVLADHPYMLEDFESGRVLDLPNLQHFDLFLNNKRRIFKMMNRVQNGPASAKVVNFGIDMGLAVGGPVALASRSKSAAQLFSKAGKFLGRGPIPLRVAKIGAFSAAANTAHEFTLRRVQPTTFGPESEALKNAAFWGTVFGVGLSAGGMALGRSLVSFGGLNLKRMQTKVQNVMTRQEADTLRGWEKQEITDAQTLLNEKPTANRTEPMLKGGAFEKVRTQLEAKYKKAGFEIDLVDHPQQSQYDLDLDRTSAFEQIMSLETPKTPRDALQQMLAGWLPQSISRGAPNDFFRMATRTTNDDFVATRDQLEDPLSAGHLNPSGEARIREFDNIIYNSKAAIQGSLDDHLKAKGGRMEWVGSDGTPYSVAGRQELQHYGDGVLDFMMQRNEFREGTRPGFNEASFPEPVRRAADAVAANHKKALDFLEDSGVLAGPRAVAAQERVVEKLTRDSQKAISGESIKNIETELSGLRAERTEATRAVRQLDREAQRAIDSETATQLGEELAALEQTRRVSENRIQDLQERIDQAPDTKSERVVLERQVKRENARLDQLDNELMVTEEKVIAINARQRLMDRIELRRRGQELTELKSEALETRLVREELTSIEKFGRRIRRAEEKIDKQIREATSPERLQEISDEIQEQVGLGAVADERIGVLERRLTRARERGNLESMLIQRREAMEKLDFLRWQEASADTYFTVRWDGEAVNISRPEMKAMMLEDKVHFHEHWGYGKLAGTKKAPSDIPVIETAKQRLRPETQKFLDDAGVVTEADILAMPRSRANAIMKEYRKALDEDFAASADGAIEAIVGYENGSGIADAAQGGNPLRARNLQLRHTRYRKFMHTGLNENLEFYGYAAGEPAAYSRALRENHAQLAEGVMRYTGKRMEIDMSLARKMGLMEEAWRQQLAMAKRGAAQLEGRPGGKGLTEKIRKVEERQDRLWREIMDKQVLRTVPRGDTASSAWQSGVRVAMKLPFLAYMGSVWVSSIMDFANVGLMTSRGTNNWRAVGRSIKGMARGATPRDMKGIAAVLDEATNSRLSSIYDLTRVAPNQKYLAGPVNRGMATLDKATELGSRKLGAWSGMNLHNRILRRVGAMNLTQEGIDTFRKLARADEALRAGKAKNSDDALRRVGLSKELAARWRRLGITAADAKLMARLTRQFGELDDGKRLIDMTDEQFANLDPKKDFIHPNFAKWNVSQKARRARDNFFAGMDLELRAIVTEPVMLSRPLQRNNFLGRMFHQFWSFGYAWGLQTYPVMNQGPSARFYSWMAGTVGLGAISDAMHNHLSGRRNIEDTAEMWANEPAGMLYKAINRSGAIGWMSRPLEIMDRSPYGIGPLTGNNVSSMHTGQAFSLAGIIGGPTLDVADRLVQNGLMPAFTGTGYDRKHLDNLLKIAPYQNLLGLKAHQLFTNDGGKTQPFGWLNPSRQLQAAPR